MTQSIAANFTDGQRGRYEGEVFTRRGNDVFVDASGIPRTTWETASGRIVTIVADYEVDRVDD